MPRTSIAKKAAPASRSAPANTKTIAKAKQAATADKPIVASPAAATGAIPLKDKKAAKAPAKKSAADKKEPKEQKEPKAKKPKLVRDSFTMPEAEYKALGEIKRDCLKAGIEVKKSELLRVGVALLRQMEPAKLQTVLLTLPSLKAGRPKKEK